MGAGSLIARKSIRARWGRTLAIAFAITASVSFVVGSFVLADSLRATFDSLFQELNENVDLEVRVPRRTSVHASLVNGGDIVITGVTGEHELSNVNGDVVACAYLGAKGAQFVGLEIPGVAVIDVYADSQECADGDFAACVRLGRMAADAGGIVLRAADPGRHQPAQRCR